MQAARVSAATKLIACSQIEPADLSTCCTGAAASKPAHWPWPVSAQAVCATEHVAPQGAQPRGARAHLCAAAASSSSCCFFRALPAFAPSPFLVAAATASRCRHSSFRCRALSCAPQRHVRRQQNVAHVPGSCCVPLCLSRAARLRLHPGMNGVFHGDRYRRQPPACLGSALKGPA